MTLAGNTLVERLQAAWDATATLPPIAFSEAEAVMLAAALAPPATPASERETAIVALLCDIVSWSGNQKLIGDAMALLLRYPPEKARAK